MKKILIDDEVFSIQDNYGGISRLISEYLKMFEKDDDIEFILPFNYSNNRHLNDTNYKKKKIFPNLKFYKKSNVIRFLNRFKVNKALKEGNYDILLLSYLDKKIVLKNKKKLISIMHDTIHEDNSKYFKNLEYLKKSRGLILEKSSCIISNSYETKKNIIRLYSIDEKKIHVVHPHNKANDNVEKLNLPENFILFVGQRKGYKNFNFLIKCLSKKKINLVCVGGNEFDKNEISTIRKNSLNDYVHYYELNDSQLNYAYQNAMCHVIVSEAEGFGVTILEAQKNDCLVLCPNLPIFYEVGKDSTIYFNLNDAENFNIQLSQILNNNYNRNIHEKMKSNLKNYNLNDKKKNLKEIFYSL